VVRERLQEDDVDAVKDGRVGSDAEGERGQVDNGEAGGPSHRPYGVL